MKDLTAQQIYDIAASVLKDKGLPEPRSVWVWHDIFSKDLIEKRIYTNKSQITIYLKIEGKELLSFKIEVSDELEYRKKLNHIISTEVKFIS